MVTQVSVHLDVAMQFTWMLVTPKMRPARLRVLQCTCTPVVSMWCTECQGHTGNTQALHKVLGKLSRASATPVTRQANEVTSAARRARPRRSIRAMGQPRA